MDQPPSISYDKTGSLSPRGLIVTGLTLQFTAAVIFWQFSIGLIATATILHPAIGFLGVLGAISIAVWLTCLAWRRNTWLVSSLFLFGCITTSPWPLIVIFVWPYPS